MISHLHHTNIAKKLSISLKQVQDTVALLDGGATIPFLARYRKEATGGLDEVAIMSIRDHHVQLRELDTRREVILRSLEERELLTDELKKHICVAESMMVLEDLYLPFRPKRRTRAMLARERGLEPLALGIWGQDTQMDVLVEAVTYVNPEKHIESVDDVLAGARDIMAEWVNEDRRVRTALRELFTAHGRFQCTVARGKDAEASKYRDYFNWEEAISTAPSHRVLAMLRGEKDSILNVHVAVPEERTLPLIKRLIVKGTNASSAQVTIAVQDSYRRLLAPSMENEILQLLKVRADETAIEVFAENVRQLLLTPPLGQKTVLAIDPGYRSGCKVVCLDPQGSLLDTDIIFPHQSHDALFKAQKILLELCSRFEVEAIAVGNGTAGRETEAFLHTLPLPNNILIVMVNESGASIYSASAVAREEFPDQDITVRGAISIGRRLMDPLAELVKVDPKSIGVGQYQHDVDQTLLKRRLEDVVMSCVNTVGVEVNMASAQLLTAVSGVGPQLAKNIVTYRNEHGPFASRGILKKVPRFGPKAFEQAAGFLRIKDATHPLDASAVHPERYRLIATMAKDKKCLLTELMQNHELRNTVDLHRYCSDDVGLPTLNDIMAELAKPGRDPREQFEPIQFTDGIQAMADLKPGMTLNGVVTNVTAFGAFVDVGVHQDGLVHISQLADHFIKDPNQIVKVQQQVKVTVLDVDIPRKRIALSMKVRSN